MNLLVNTKDLLGYVVHDNEKDIADLHGTVHTELEDWVDDGLRVFSGPLSSVRKSRGWSP